jgi:TRAP-type C4-dicarboxylate transport system permease small subunit
MLFLGSARQTIANWSNISPMSGIPVGAMYLAGAFAGALIAAIAVLRFLVPRHSKVSGREEQE